MTPDFQRDYPIRLPLPLAQLYSRAYHDKDARARHNNAFYLFEATTKLAAATAAAAYLHEVQHGAPRVTPLDRLLAHLALPSLGQWVALLRELARHFGTRPDAAAHPLGHLWRQLTQPHTDLPGLLALFQRVKNGPEGTPTDDRTVSVLETLEALVQYRNAVFGHGAEREADFYEREMGPLLFPALNDLLADQVLDLLGPRGSRLVHLTELRLQDGNFVEVGLRELINLRSERTAPLLLASESAAALAPNRVAVLWPGRPVPLRLDPLLIYRESETADEVLFLNRGRNRQVEYLSYTTGRTERDRAMAPALAELLSRITNSPVSEEQLRQLAAQSFAETPSVERLFGTTTAATRLGDYEILGEIGRGGMGVVVLARQLSLGRLVALKMLPADLAGDEVALARFRREIRALSRCDHPHIVKVLTTGTMPDGQLYYAMEYVPGCDLEMVWKELSGSDLPGDASRLSSSTWVRAVQSAARKKRYETTKQSTTTATDDPKVDAPGAEAPANWLPPLPELPDIPDDAGGYTGRVASLMRDAAQALHAVHEQGLVHRDVKPGNLMLTPDGKRIVLMDFGLAKGKSLATPLTKGGGLLGTLRYAAPEQLAAATLKVGPPADVRGLGATLWELLTRRRLFGEAEDEAQLAQKVHDEDVPRLRMMDAGFDRDLEAIVARATERRVTDRITSARLLSEYLEMYLEGKPLPIRTPGPAEIVWRWVREHRPLVAAVAMALLFVIATVVAAFVLITDSRNRAVQLADDNGKLATDMQGLAERNGKLAVDMKGLADHNGMLLKQTEQLAADRAVALREEARQRLRAEWQVYRGQIETAFRALREKQPGLAEATLDACRWDFRGWEYYFARRQLDSTRLVLDRPGRFLNALAFSPDGKRLAVACGDYFIVCDSLTGMRLLRCAGHEAQITALAFAPDGSFLVSAAKDQTARVWDSAGKGQVFTGHQSEVVSLDVSPDGKAVATGDANGTILVWDPKTLKELHRYQEHKGNVALVAFSRGDSKWYPAPDHELLSLGKDGQLIRRNLLTGKAKTESIPAGFQTAAVSPFHYYMVGVSVGNGYSHIRVRALAAEEWGSPKEVSGKIKQVALINQWSQAQDHEVCLVAATDDSILVLDTSGKEIWRLHGGVALPARLVAFACGPSGRTIAASTGWELVPGTVKLWDAGREWNRAALRKEKFETMETVDTVFSPDGRFIVVGRTGRFFLGRNDSGKGEVSIIALPDFKEQRVITTPGEVRSVAVSPDARFLASGHTSGSAVLWEVATGKRLRNLGSDPGEVTALAFSPDGALVASGGDNATVYLTDSSSGKVVRRLKGHTLPIRALAFSPDGKVLASGGVDATVSLWDTETGAEKGVLRGHGSRVTTLAFGPGGRRLASGSADTTVRLWDVASAKQVWAGRETRGRRVEVPGVSDPRQILQVVFTPDGKRVISLAGAALPPECTIRFWDAETGESAWSLDDEWKGTTLALSRDGRQLLSCSFRKDSMAVWEASDPFAFEPRLLRGQSLAIRTTAFSADSRFIACGSNDRSLVLYNAVSGQPETNFALASPCVCLAFHPNQGRLAYNDGERRITLRDLAAKASPLYLDHPDEVLAVAYSPDGGMLATGCKDKKARLWDAATGRERATLEDHEGRVSCICFTPDGATLVTGSWDGKVRLWDIGSRTLRTRLDASDEGVSSVTVSKDGRFLLTGGLDGIAKVWDLRDGKEVTSLKAHGEAVTGLVVLPSGLVLSAGADGVLHGWDLATGRSRHHVWVGGEGVLSLSLNADCSQIVAACKDGIARVRNVRSLNEPRRRYDP